MAMRFGPGGGAGLGTGYRARSGGRAGMGMGAAEQPDASKAGFIHLLRQSWPFVRPQRWLLLVGLLLMAVNRAAGLVLPSSAKYLLDNVVLKREAKLLVPLVLAVVAATAVQGITSFTLTQLLSK